MIMKRYFFIYILGITQYRIINKVWCECEANIKIPGDSHLENLK